MDIGLIVIYAIPLLIIIVSLWFIFRKAGRPEWAAIIPIYNIYVTLKVSERSGWWTILWFIPWVDLFVMALIASGMAKRFSKGAAFALGLFFVPFVFLPILAFGNATYSGQKPKPVGLQGMKRPKTQSSNLSEADGYYCANCGNDIDNAWDICANCGAKLN